MFRIFTSQFSKKIAFGISIFLLTTAFLTSPFSKRDAFAAAEGVLGWGWNGQYYGSATEACRAQWEWAGMNNGKSRFIGAFDRPNSIWSKNCSWTSYQYLAPQEVGCGVFSCGTVLPSITSFACASGYTRVFPYSCVKTPDYRPQRPMCGYGNGGKPNPAIGNPIILSSGTKYHSTEDFSAGDGKLSVSRTYRSNPIGRNVSAQYLPLGLPNGWQFSFTMELQLGTFSGSPSSPNANVTLIAPDGSPYDFKLNTNGTWTTDSSSGSVSSDFSLEYIGTLPTELSTVKSSSSNWLITGPDDRRWSLQTFAGVNTTTLFDVARPTSVEDREGYIWTYNYDPADHRLLSIVDTYNRTISFSWNYFYITTVSGRAGSLPFPEAISTITFPDGTKATYEYDPVPASAAPSTGKVERLVAVRWKDSTDTIVDSEIYHYEDADYPHALTGITDGRGSRVATYAYDDRGRAISTAGASGSDTFTVEYGTDGSQDTRRVTNPLGKVAVYRFSHVGSSTFDIQLAGVDGEASSHCVASDSSFTYDSNGYVATWTDEEGRVTSYVRDVKGRPTLIRQATGTPDERTTTVVWHATLNVPTSIARQGLTTTYSYNLAGQLIDKTEADTTTSTVPYSTAGQSRTWSYTYTSSGLLQSADGPKPGTSDAVSYTYDANGYVATFTNEVGHLYTVIATNGRGLPTQLQDPNGVIENLTYDARGRLISSTVDPTGSNAQTVLEYDAAGNVSKVTQPSGNFTAFEYDGNDRITKLTNNLGESNSYSYDLMGNVTLSEIKNASEATYFKEQKTFDELGRLRQVIRAGSATWAFGYDKVGNQLSVTDPNSNATASTYDKLNRLVSFADERTSTTNWGYGATNAPVSTTDPHSVTTNYVRNGWDEVIQEQSNDIGTVVYERDQTGNITKRTDARGIVANLTYDAAGRLLTTNYPSETSSNVAYSYDAGTNGMGRLTGITDATGTVSRTYDRLGRVSQETRTIGSQTYVTAFEWDASGKLTQITYPSGRIVTFGRNSVGNVESVHTRVSSTGPEVGLAWWISHTPFGPRHGLLHGNELTDWRTYDEDGRIETQSLHDESVSPATELINRSYGYADKRNLTAIDDNLDASRNESYWYTPNGFLQNADGPWGALTFYIDGVGNITHRILEVGGSSTTENFTIPYDSNRLSGAITNGAQSRTFGSDASGNIVTETTLSTNTTKTFGYNAAGQLESVTTGNQTSGQYTYDYLSRLKTRALPGSSTVLHYVHDLDGHIIAEYDSSGTLAREYIWLDERPLAVVADAGTSSAIIYHVHTDHLERPIMMTDGAKNVVWKATYLPFGGLHTLLGSATLDQRFPGQWFQLESGLHYNWHRHYDPTTGRYLQPDPLGMPDGPSRWAYVINSPLMYVDPEGLQLKFLGPSDRGGRICGVICGGYGCRLDYHGYKGGPPVLHFHFGPVSRPGWGPPRPLFAPWTTMHD
ncbi:MAG: RHS repeat-associated core domain-containing protein [Allorhizobium sp.]